MEDMKNKNKLIRQQLDRTLKKFQPLLAISIPQKGWIRAIRDALGMSGQQLADRVGVTKQRTSYIEGQELSGTATLNTMRKIAECLDCVFVYGFVPRTSLEDTIRTQAEQVAARDIAWASHTMTLEDQALTIKENEKVLSDMVKDLVDNFPSRIWNLTR